jgi:predicted lipoprotein with Yx(FWY)xxD motif
MSTTRIPTAPRTRALGSLALAGVLALAATAVAPVASLAQDGEPIAVSTATDDLGTYLVGPEGLTLYYFTRDVTPGQSVCVDGCLEAWPPLLVGEGQQLTAGDDVSGTLATFARDDGTMQAAYRGRPLYYWQGDTEAGQTTGHGVNDIWWVADVSGSLPAE